MSEEGIIPEEFKAVMRARTGCAVIMAGSDSDKPHIEKIIAGLEEFEVPYLVRIVSSHKQPLKVAGIITHLNETGGVYLVVAVAGGQDAVSGITSYNTFGLVISCPPDSPNDSPLRNPPGSSNVTVYKPKDVGRAIAQAYCGVNPRFKELLQASIDKKVVSLNEKDAEFSKKYCRTSYGSAR